jgi:hypothetical protein
LSIQLAGFPSRGNLAGGRAGHLEAARILELLLGLYLGSFICSLLGLLLLHQGSSQAGAALTAAPGHLSAQDQSKGWTALVPCSASVRAGKLPCPNTLRRGTVPAPTAALTDRNHGNTSTASPNLLQLQALASPNTAPHGPHSTSDTPTAAEPLGEIPLPLTVPRAYATRVWRRRLTFFRCLSASASSSSSSSSSPAARQQCPINAGGGSGSGRSSIPGVQSQCGGSKSVLSMPPAAAEATVAAPGINVGPQAAPHAHAAWQAPQPAPALVAGHPRAIRSREAPTPCQALKVPAGPASRNVLVVSTPQAPAPASAYPAPRCPRWRPRPGWPGWPGWRS